MTYEIATSEPETSSSLEELYRITPNRFLEWLSGPLQNDEAIIVVNKEWFKKNANTWKWHERVQKYINTLIKNMDVLDRVKSDVVMVKISGDDVKAFESPLPVKHFVVATREYVDSHKEDEKVAVIIAKGRRIDHYVASKIFDEASNIITASTASVSEGVKRTEVSDVTEKILDEVAVEGSRIEEETARIYEPIIMALGRGVVPISASAGFFRIIREVEKRVGEVSDDEIRRALGEVKDMLAEEIANVVKSTKVIRGMSVTTLKNALRLDDEKLKEYAAKEAEKLINDNNFRALVAAGVHMIKNWRHNYTVYPKMGEKELGYWLSHVYIYAVRMRGYTTADVLVSESRTLGLAPKPLEDYKRNVVQSTMEDIPDLKFIYREKIRASESEESLVSAGS